MSFDDDDLDNDGGSGGDGKKPKTFFGMELSDGMVYGIVIVLTIIFIRQVATVLQAPGYSTLPVGSIEASAGLLSSLFQR